MTHSKVNMELSAKSSMFELLDGLFDELFPISRSITGPGLRQSLDIFSRYMPLAIEIIPTGTKVFDWVVPPEWRLKRASLTGSDGRTILDDSTCWNLQIVNYSTPVDAVLPLEELDRFLHSLPALPDAVPYVTSYYKRSWGFCLKDSVRRALPPGNYQAIIDSEFIEGGVPVADCVLRGESDAEIMLTSYLCHPSLANNELSGPLVLLGLYQRIIAWPRRRYSYRFVLNPETIGSLCYLHLKAGHLKKHLAAGMVLTCLGGSDHLSYKMSRRGCSNIDRTVVAIAEKRGIRIRKFDPTGGSDERQYCSPGFNFPVGQMARTVYGEFVGYHNSLDNKEFMSIASLVRSIDEIEALLKTAEIAGCFCNLSPYGEPALGPRGLYPNINSPATWMDSSDELWDSRTFLNRLLTILNYSDGQHTMLDIAAQMSCNIEVHSSHH